MRKHTVFLMVLCHTLVWVAIYFAVPNSLCSCSLVTHLQSYEHETVTFTLPQWPKSLPPLQGWSISCDSGKDTCREQTLSLTTTDTSFTLRVKKNEPFYICAQPITKTQGFFKCAGTIYPYSKSITWSGGYAACTMKSLKITAPQSYLLRFNWERFITTLQQKQEKSENTYNPWLLDSPQVLEAIAYHNFTATKLNMTATLAIQLDFPVFSSYVPQNLEQNTRIIKKGNPELFLIDDGVYKTGVIICGTTLKKISMDVISMPIFTEGI